MKHNWGYKRLGDVATYVNGYAFKPSDWLESGYPIIRIQNFNNRDAEYNYSNGNISSKYFVSNGDLLISWSASLGAYIWHGDKAVLNQHIFKVVFDKTNIVKNYLKYFVDFSLPLMASKTHGATMKHITKPRFDALPIPFPPMEVQQQIVAELDKINEVIEDCRELLRNLDALAQSLFYDYFGDPVTNAKGWTVCKVSENFETGSGGTPSKSIPEFWNSNDIPWIGSNMCQNEILHKTDGKFISNLGLQNSSAKLLYPDTLLVALVGATIGKVALLKIPTSTNQNIGFIKPNKDIANPIFLFYTLQGLYPLFLGIGNGKFKMANLSFIRDLPIILPPLELQEKFAERIEQIDAQKKAVEETIANLQTLLDSRMDYWFN